MTLTYEEFKVICRSCALDCCSLCDFEEKMNADGSIEIAKKPCEDAIRWLRIKIPDSKVEP